MENLKAVNVFIASAGDVPEARSFVRRAIGRINRLLANDSGFHFKAVGWEEIPPGKSSRAQEIINPYVDSADIFLGILNQRFGRPTGIAESGTEEEYLIIEKRWKYESIKPTISLFFKKIPPDRLSDPGPQLKKMLKFKARISGTNYYSEFEDDHDIEEKIENVLANWIKQQKDNPAKLQNRQIDILDPVSIKILSIIVKTVNITFEEICSEIKSKDSIRSSVKKLEKQGYIQKSIDGLNYTPSNSTDAFVSIAKHLNNEDYYKLLLESSYYYSMLNTRIESIIYSRMHCKFENEALLMIKRILLLSPSAISFILFGDTAKYDNSIDQVQNFDEGKRQVASEYILSNVIHNVLLCFIQDSTKNITLKEINGKKLIGVILTLKISAALEGSNAFEILSEIPMMLHRVKGNVKAGQMLFGPADIHIQNGNAFFHMNKLNRALDEFNQAISQNLTENLKVIVLNNKGLVFLRMRNPIEAEKLFLEALKIDPNLKEAKNNLKLAKKEIKKLKRNNLKIMNNILIPTQSPEDWKKLLAEPEKHWKDGYSAKTLAYCWQNANGFPPEISRIFNGSEYTELHDLDLLMAFPEYQVSLPPIKSHPSQNDLFVLARTTNGKLVSMTIEGKVSEPFGPVMKKWYSEPSVGKIERLKFIKEHIGINEDLPENIRYQLLHRTASAVIEAKKFNASIAVMLVHSFSKTNEWFEDYQLFLGLYGIKDVNVDRLYFLKSVSGIQLFSGWVKGAESNKN